MVDTVALAFLSTIVRSIFDRLSGLRNLYLCSDGVASVGRGRFTQAGFFGAGGFVRIFPPLLFSLKQSVIKDWLLFRCMSGHLLLFLILPIIIQVISFSK